MIIYKVVRPKDTVYVSIFKYKNSELYSFINLSKTHICNCKFNSYEEALNDMNKKISEGSIISYAPLNCKNKIFVL